MLVPRRVLLNIPLILKHQQHTRTWKTSGPGTGGPPSEPLDQWSFPQSSTSSVQHLPGKPRPKTTGKGGFLLGWFGAFLWSIYLPSSLEHSFFFSSKKKSLRLFWIWENLRFVSIKFQKSTSWKATIATFLEESQKRFPCIWQVIFVQPMQRPAADSQRVTLHFKIYP